MDSHSNEYLLAKIGFDTAENEPFQVCPLSAYRSPRSWLTTEQLMAQPDHKAAYNEYRKTGVVPTYFYSEDVYGENINEMAEDEVVVFLESTGMVA